MKHVHESLSQYYDYKFFKVFEEEKEEKEEKTELQDKEKDGLAIIEKIKSNFEKFKKSANDEILKYKEFWEENKKTKEGFSEEGNVYKMYDSNYVVGVMELPVETLSDGSIDGGMGASGEPEEEIIEGKEIGAEPTNDVSEGGDMPVSEAEETGDGLDLNLDDEEEDKTDLDATSTDDTTSALTDPATPEPAEIPETPDTTADTGDSTDTTGDLTSEPTSEPSLTEPQTYFVVYDVTGDEREEIFRCGSDNVVNGFTSFYNDTFKGSMKNMILKYKEQKEQLKKEAEEAEKQKAETAKQDKVKKFLSEGKKIVTTNII